MHRSVIIITLIIIVTIITINTKQNGHFVKSVQLAEVRLFFLARF